MTRKWILIADGSRAKILEKTKNDLRYVEFTHHASDIPTYKDKGHHQPEAVSPSVVHAKHSFPPREEWGEFEKKVFAKSMAEIIDARVGEFDALMIIAPGKITYEIKSHLNKEALSKLIEEVHKDYTHTPIEDIERMF